MAEDKEINPYTGKPLDGSAPIVDTTLEDSPGEVNPYTGKPLEYVAPKVTLGGGDAGRQMLDSGITSGRFTSRRGEAITNFTDYNVPLGQELDWEEIRALNQSTAEQWGRGLAKAGVTTIGAVAENTLGVLFGLGSLATGGAYYDNAVGRTVDKTNEWMRENMPNYLTREEQKMNTFQKLGTANFWADTVANGLGYSLGSMATMYLTGGMGLFGLTSKAISGAAKGTALYNTTKAIVNGTKLGTKIAKGASNLTRTMRAAQVLEAGLMMSLAEASVEARESQKNSYNSLVENYLQENNLDNEGQIPADIRANFEDVSYATANTNFVMQLPVLAGTNLMMFGKQVAGFRAATRASKDVVFDAASRKAVSKFANNTRWQNTLNILKPIGMEQVEEGFQEGFQFFSGEFAHSYHTDKLKNGGYADMGKALNNALSKTFGSQEGLESILVGILTAGIIGGGRSVVSRPYSNRKQNAQVLADVINGGFLDGTANRLGYANASATAMKRMQGALNRNDIKTFKDEQFKLISYNALQALEMGGFDVFMQKLEDAGSLSDTEFAEAFGIPTTDEKGQSLTLEQATGESKAEILSGLKSKLDNIQKVYNNVNDRFALPDKTSGLPRKLMGEEARKAEDKTYNERAALRNELILRGAETQDRTRRMGDLQKDMQKTIDDSLASNNKMMDSELNINNALKDFSIFQTEPGETDAKDFDARKTYKDMLANLNKAIETLSKIDPVAARQLREQAQDYADLSTDTFAALDVYNKLASDPYAQAVFQRNLKAEQEATQAREQEKEFTEELDKTKTSQDVADLGKSRELTNPQKRLARKRYNELKAKEDQYYKKYKAIKGLSVEEKLEKLEKIDKTKLSDAELGGLRTAINELKAQKTAKDKGLIDVQPGDQTADDPANETVDVSRGELEVDEAFEPINLGNVQVISENGRTFQIDGEVFYNTEPNPTDAIDKGERSGKIKKVTLEDANGNRRIFITKDTREALAYAIYMSEAFKMEGQPTIDEAKERARNRAAKKKLEKLAYKGKHGNKTSESLRSEIFTLERTLDQLLEDYDGLKLLSISDNKTIQEIDNDPEMRERKREINSIRAQIRARKGVLKARQEPLSPTDVEKGKLAQKAQEAIEESKDYLKILNNEIADLEADIEAIEPTINQYKNDEDFDSYKAATAALKQAKDKLEQKRKDVLDAEAQIVIEEKQLKRITDENETGLPDDGEQAPESTATETERQVDVREDRDNRESVREEGTTVDGVTPIQSGVYEVEYRGNTYTVNENTGTITNNRTGNVLQGGITSPTGNAIVQKVMEYEEFATQSAPIIVDDTAEPIGKDEQAVEKSVKNNEKSAEAAEPTTNGKPGGLVIGSDVADLMGMSEEDLRSDMPPAEGPTLGEALQQQRPAAVPPKYNYNPTNLTNDERNEFKNYLIDKLGQPTSIQITEDKDGYRFTFKDGLVIETSAKGKSASYPRVTQEIVDLAKIDPGYDIKFLVGLNKLAEERFKKQPIGKRSEGDNIDVKSAMSDRALKDPSTNRSQIEVTPAGSPTVNAPDTLDGNIIPISRELLVQAQAGTEVEFEIIENDFYKENFPNGSVADIPVYFKIGGQIVGKLQRSESQDRAEIVRKLQAGETVTTKIASVISPNFNNARTADGQKYFYDPREAFGQTPTIVGTVVTDGILEFDAPTGDLTMRTPRGVTPGQVGFLIPADQNPEATDNVSMGSTADLTREAVTAVGEALKQKDFAKAQEIVASSDESRRGAGYARGDYLEFGQFGDGRNYMVYRSPSENRLVRLDETNLEKALNNKPFRLGFVDVDQNGDYKSVSAQEADYTRIKDTFKKDFADFLADKKYNVNTQLANTPGQYTSPVTGQVYPSYQDYLFSPTERAGTTRTEGQGYNSILTTDVVRTSMGFFHNPVISFSKGDILGKTTEDIAEKTTFESTKPGPSIDDMLNQLPNMFANDKASQNLTKDC